MQPEVNDDCIWVTDLAPLRFNKLDFKGNHLYTWMVPRELSDGYIEVHTFSVDSKGNLYVGEVSFVNLGVRFDPPVYYKVFRRLSRIS